MAGAFSKELDRRSALAVLGAAGLSLVEMPKFSMLADEHKDPHKETQIANLLPAMKRGSHDLLSRVVRDSGFSGQITPSDAASLLAIEGKSAEQVMVDLLPLARSYAHPPISNYFVGAIARGISGALYLGSNVEFPGHPLGFAVHGEQFALSNAYMHSEPAIASIAVTAAPCGHCRQFMTEISPEGNIQVVIAGSSPVKLSTLLPMAFGPKDLGFKDGALPVKKTNLEPPKGTPDDVTLAALDAACKSYAPYSKSPAGVALRTSSGRIFTGAYIENVAFNPSLGPFQVALAALIVAGQDISGITRAVLVETDGAAISQRSVAEAALMAVSHGAQLERIAVKAAA